ncbi:MAG: hypothetical protein GAK28_04766 [Luteibacter sp.]|uniref:hypothetical protein n=1 Tax=Luteibacter sp. TaxID=1886636 RepID=UPI0013806619|nr:hypothetical protein [Luteibacter sp.]KAF1003327.1 MAG: hypothetical protein GAK28_04766 [Luteibacter sp.]
MEEVPCFFAVFGLPKPTYEHAKIVDVIREASGGDFKQFPVPGGIGFVFATNIKPWNLSFDRVLLNGDTVFITEITRGSFVQRGFGAASGWINTHFPRD